MLEIGKYMQSFLISLLNTTRWRRFLAFDEVGQGVLDMVCTPDLGLVGRINVTEVDDEQHE